MSHAELLDPIAITKYASFDRRPHPVYIKNKFVVPHGRGINVSSCRPYVTIFFVRFGDVFLFRASTNRIFRHGQPRVLINPAVLSGRTKISLRFLERDRT